MDSEPAFLTAVYASKLSLELDQKTLVLSKSDLLLLHFFASDKIGWIVAPFWCQLQGGWVGIEPRTFFC